MNSTLSHRSRMGLEKRRLSYDTPPHRCQCVVLWFRSRSCAPPASAQESRGMGLCVDEAMRLVVRWLPLYPRALYPLRATLSSGRIVDVGEGDRPAGHTLSSCRGAV